MTTADLNIFPEHDKILEREDKEKLLKQHGMVLWFTGLSGSGKTTIAIELEKKLHENGYLTQILDGDKIRNGINNNLGFTVEDRYENIRRIAEIGKLFIDCGIITICSFISPTQKIRSVARSIIGKKNFVEIYTNAPLDVCEKRDVKGLYKKAREGKIKNFSGISSPYEAPENPDLELKTEEMSVEEATHKAYEYVLPLINNFDKPAKKKAEEDR